MEVARNIKAVKPVVGNYFKESPLPKRGALWGVSRGLGRRRSRISCRKSPAEPLAAPAVADDDLCVRVCLRREIASTGEMGRRILRRSAHVVGVRIRVEGVLE